MAIQWMIWYVTAATSRRQSCHAACAYHVEDRVLVCGNKTIVFR